jgi:hypothetical protein
LDTRLVENRYFIEWIILVERLDFGTAAHQELEYEPARYSAATAFSRAVFVPAFFAAHMRLAASAIRARPSGLIERLPPLAFLAGLPVFFPGAASAALFSAHRLRVASPIRARPSALICPFPPRAFLPGGLPSFFAAGAMSRSAASARSIASRCCSSCEMTLSISFNESPNVSPLYYHASRQQFQLHCTLTTGCAAATLRCFRFCADCGHDPTVAADQTNGGEYREEEKTT